MLTCHQKEHSHVLQDAPTAEIHLSFLSPLRKLVNNMRTVQIDRSKWRCGPADKRRGHSLERENRDISLDSENGRCCLGFAVNQLHGIPYECLLDLETPCEVSSIPESSPFVEMYKPIWSETEQLRDSDFTREAMSINDRMSSTRQQKESALTKLFKKNNINLVFHGEYTY